MNTRKPTGAIAPSAGSMGGGGTGGQGATTTSTPGTGNVPPGAPITWTPSGNWHGPTGNQGTVHRRWVEDTDRELTSLIFREKNDDAVRVEFVGKKLCADTERNSRTDHTYQTQSGGHLALDA